MKFTTSILLLLLFINPIPHLETQDRSASELVFETMEIERKPVVKYVIPDGIPNGDVYFNTIADVLRIINVDDLHNLGYKGDNVVVGVIDTGINKNLPVFGGRVIDERSFVTLENGYDEAEGVDDIHGHGTKVASLIAGNDTANNYIGGAPHAKLISAKVADKNGIITSDALIAALGWLGDTEDVDIISISLSEPEEGITEDPLEEAVKMAASKGKLIFMSAGNSGSSANSINYFTMGSPSSSPHVITMGATDNSNNIAYFSSNGPTMDWSAKPDLVSPGSGIPTISSTGSKVTVSGTSFSTPLSAGATASILSAVKANNISYNYGLIKSALSKNAVDLGKNWALQGNGLLDALSTWDYILSLESESAHLFPNQIPFITRTSLPAGEKLDVRITATSNIIGPWSIASLDFNFSGLIDLSHGNFVSGLFNTPIILNIHPGRDFKPGFYSSIIEINSPDNRILPIQLEITITPPAKKKLLLDLLHTPWDSVLRSSSDTRYDRFLGEDMQGMIDLLRSKNIWVEELLAGDLTDTVLSDYDILWLPSAFAMPTPSNFDHDISRDTLLTSEELLSIQNFVSKGGDLLIDFGGTSKNDPSFDFVFPDEQSLRSLLNILGVEINGEFSEDTSIVGSSPQNSSNLYSAVSPFSSPAGKNTLKYGLSIMVFADGTSTVGVYGKNGNRVLISNARNWRDEPHMQLGIYQNELIDWLLDDEQIQHFDYHQTEETTVVSLKLNTSGLVASELNLVVSRTDNNGYTYPVSILSIIQKDDMLFEISLEKVHSEQLNINLSYREVYQEYSLFIEDQKPISVIIKGKLSEDYNNFRTNLVEKGLYEWNVLLEDDEPLYKYQINTVLSGDLAMYADWEFNPSSSNVNSGILSISLHRGIIQDEIDLKALIGREILNFEILILQSNGRITHKTMAFKFNNGQITSTSTEKKSYYSLLIFPTLIILSIIIKWGKTYRLKSRK